MLGQQLKLFAVHETNGTAIDGNQVFGGHLAEDAREGFGDRSDNAGQLGLGDMQGKGVGGVFLFAQKTDQKKPQPF